MIIILSLCFVLQNQRFYEYYDEGMRAFQQEDYEDAIAALELAIKLDPESSANKKTYGVQLIKYYPYHHLTYAHLILGHEDKARAYLEQAKRYGEDRDDMVRSKLTLYEGYLGRNEPPTSVASSPDITGVTELISVGNYSGALQVIRNLQSDYPDDESLEALSAFAEEAIRTNSALTSIQKRIEQDVGDTLAKARTSEIQGDLESAYFFYQLVDRMLPLANDEARAFIQRYESSLGQNDSQEQIEFLETRLHELQDDNASLLARVQDQNQERENLDKRIGDLQLQTEQAKRLTTRIAPSVSIEWISNQVGDLFEFSAAITSNVSLLQAELSVNQKIVKEWDIRGRRTFKIPALTQTDIPIQEGLNQFDLVITDYLSQSHTKSYRTNISHPDDNTLMVGLRIAIVGLCFILLFAFILLQRRQRIAFRERFNPYIAGAPVLSDSMFFGRRSLLRQILNTLHNNSLMICGERRIGKTSFLHRLHAVLPDVDDNEYEFIPVLIDLQGVSEIDFFAFLDHEISGTLQARGLETEDYDGPIDARVFVHRLRKSIQLLKEACEKNPKLVLLLDEVDVMNSFSERTNQQLRSVFMKGFARHIVAVMAGIHISKRWKSEGSPWYNFFEQIELKAFSDIQAKTLITEPVKGVYSFTKEAVDQILLLTDGKPYLIQKICVNLVAHILNENRRKITLEDVRYVFQEIQRDFQQAVDDLNPELI